MRTGIATLIAYARVNGWKAAVSLMDTHNRIADDDDQLIDTVEAMHGPSYADVIWGLASKVQRDNLFLTLSAWR